MPRLAVAREHHIDAIYRESHRVWGAGLAFDGYREMWRELSRTPWARNHATFYVWLDGADRVLSGTRNHTSERGTSLELIDRAGDQKIELILRQEPRNPVSPGGTGRG